MLLPCIGVGSRPGYKPSVTIKESYGYFGKYTFEYKNHCTLKERKYCQDIIDSYDWLMASTPCPNTRTNGCLTYECIHFKKGSVNIYYGKYMQYYKTKVSKCKLWRN